MHTLKKTTLIIALMSVMPNIQANSDVPYYQNNTVANAAPTATPSGFNGNGYTPNNAAPATNNNVYTPQYSNGVTAQPYTMPPQQGTTYPQQGGVYPQQGVAYPQQGTTYPQQGQGAPVDANGQPYPVVQQTTEVQALPADVVQQQQQNAMATYQQQGALQRFWNMSDKDIRDMKTQVEQKQAAIYQDVSPNRCTQREMVVSSAPNEPLPFLSLDIRNKANIMFVDASGSPWPIHYVLANPTQVSTIYDDTDAEASVLYVNAAQDYSQGNFTVKLADNPVPIVFTFAANQRQVDCLVTVRLGKLSPKTKNTTQDYSPSTLDASLNSTLFGMAPKGSKALVTNDMGVSAWLGEDGDVILRTKYKIISPMPKSRIGSPDGTWVFKVQRSPTYLYNFNGVIKSFNVTQ